MNSTFTVWKRADTDGGSTEGSDPASGQDAGVRQSIVLKGPTQDHGGNQAATKKAVRKSSYKKVTSAMSSMKKFFVKKVYGSNTAKTPAPAQQIEDNQSEVSAQQAEAAGVPSRASG